MKIGTIILAAAALSAGCHQPWSVKGVRLGTYEQTVIEQEETYPWTSRSKWLFGGMVLLHYWDLQSSLDMNFGEPLTDGGHFNETNFLLDDHPSDSEVALFKGGVVLATVLLAEIFPKHRDIIFFCSALAGGVAACNNQLLLDRHK